MHGGGVARFAWYAGGLVSGHRRATDRMNGRSEGVGPVDKRTSRPEPSVRFSTCRAARELSIDPSRRSGDSRRKGRPLRRCACPCGGATRTGWRRGHCGAVVLAGGVDPAAWRGRRASVEERGERLGDGAAELVGEVVRSKPVLEECRGGR